jgi:hypothetical protein
MKVLWTFLKVILVLALLGPLAIIALATTVGILGALVGLAFFALRIAFVGFVIWGAYRLLKALFGSDSPKPVSPEVRSLPPRDPHYEAALRELDRELGSTK